MGVGGVLNRETDGSGEGGDVMFLTAHFHAVEVWLCPNCLDRHQGGIALLLT